MSDPSTKRVSPFEAIRHSDEAGEFWSARELASVLEYANWQNFSEAIERAKTTCTMSGQLIADHFTDTSKILPIVNNRQRRIEDVHLSRFACYVLVQNADPSKRMVALGQAYFAVQTRRAELMQSLADKTIEQQRIMLRDQIADENGQLAEVAGESGVVTQRDFGIFQDHGYRGLYNETSKQIAVRKRIKPGEHILDYMEPEEMIANLFRISQTQAKLRRDSTQTKDGANETHWQVGRVVRRAIEEIGGTLPEVLPTSEKSMQQVRREEARRFQIETEDRLGLFGPLLQGDAAEEAE